MTIVVAYNDDAALKTHLNDFEKIGEAEVVDTAKEVADAIGGTLMPVRRVRDAVNELRRNPPDLIFNLCEGVEGRPRWEMHFALALEMLGIPFTGCDPIATGICGDKWMTKQLLSASGITTPHGFVVRDAHEVPAVDGTWIVKPSLEDAGIGIDETAVCATRAQLVTRCAHVLKTYQQPALVEEFVDGDEFNQALFFGPNGIVILPPGEIVFAPELEPRQRLVGWKAKWSEGSAEDRATTNRTPADIDDSLKRRIAAVCTRAADTLSIGGYARFDLRRRSDGELCIVDVNPNPDIGRNTGFRKALAAAGIEFADFLNQLMIAARVRSADPHERPSR